MTDLNIEETRQIMKDFGFVFPEKVFIKIPDSETWLRKGLEAYAKNHDYKYLEQYSKVVDWMSNNDGRGLLLMGNVGLGKTTIGGKIIPHLIWWFTRWVVSPYTAQELNKRLDEALTRKCVFVDDIGRENPINDYGNKRMAVPEIVDMAERKGNLLILTTNLNKEQLEAKYGIRTLDRLREITKCITFEGESMRG